jgi:protein TonB
VTLFGYSHPDTPPYVYWIPVTVALALHSLLVALFWPSSSVEKPVLPKSESVVSVSLIAAPSSVAPPLPVTQALAPEATQPEPVEQTLPEPEPTPEPAIPEKIAPAKAAKPPPKPAPRATPRQSVAASTPAPVVTAASSDAVSPVVSNSSPPARAPEPDPVLIEARHDADYLKNPAPAYPAMARRLGEEGRVVIRAQVGADGLPQAVDVRVSSGSERLDNAALEAVRKWRFIPARRGDIAVASWVQIPFNFSLEH